MGVLVCGFLLYAGISALVPQTSFAGKPVDSGVAKCRLLSQATDFRERICLSDDGFNNNNKTNKQTRNINKKYSKLQVRDDQINSGS